MELHLSLQKDGRRKSVNQSSLLFVTMKAWVLIFWDTYKNKVQVRYLDSLFLGHATAADLRKKVDDGLAGLDLSKQIQLAMDGTNVNWKLLSDMKKEREEGGLNNLVNIGSCNLHVVHGALKWATEATKWNLQAIMKGWFQIFKDSPLIFLGAALQMGLKYSERDCHKTFNRITWE